MNRAARETRIDTAGGEGDGKMSATRKRVDHTETKNRIVDTAEKLFREVGYAKTTVADIATVLGMSSANVYRYFETKAAINETICERLVRNVEARCRETLTPIGTQTEKLERCILEYHRSVKRTILMDRRMHDMVAAAMEQHWSVINSHMKRMQELFGALLLRGTEAGEFREMDPQKTARLLHGAVAVFVYPALVERLINDAAASGTADSLEEDLRSLLDLLLKGLHA